MRRLQTSDRTGEVWSRLFNPSPSVIARRRLRRVMRELKVPEPVRYKREGAGFSEAEDHRKAARAIVEDAKSHPRGDWTVGGVMRVRQFVGDPSTPAVPAAASRTAATRKTLAFHQEVSLVFEARAKTLGLYLPRPLKDDIPPNWSVGDRWPAGAYASEHAWAAAEDWGMGDEDRPGKYETDQAKLFPFLASLTDYILANFARLGVDEHIFDSRSYRAAPNAQGYTVSPYGGSDTHRTHTHTQFGDHGGRVPPWV